MKRGVSVQSLKKLRKGNGLTQKSLGNIIGVSESAISLYESGKRQPDQETLGKFASYFHVTVDYLLGREDEPNETQKEPAVKDSELDPELISLMESLSEEDFQRVKDFVAGLKAARGESASHQP